MRYDRQESLDIVQTQTVAIVGCGGIGSWVAFYLTLAGVAVIHLFDGDNVSDHNLNRLPLPVESVGQTKSTALALYLWQYNKEVTIRPHGHFDPEMHNQLLLGISYFIVCTDTWKSRKMVYDACKPLDIGYLECGAEGNEASLSPSPPEWVMPSEDEPGYQHVPVFVGPCAAIAAMAAYYVLYHQVPTKTFRIGWKDNNLTLNTWEEPDGKEREQTRSEESSQVEAPDAVVQPDNQDD